MSASLSLGDQIRQLNDARKLVLGDVKYFPSVIQGILPVIGPSARFELRRWGAEFLSEAFATPALHQNQKETMQLSVLDTLQRMLENPQEDAKVVVNLIQAAASIYPFALRWTINNSYDTQSWERMMAIKARILQIWTEAVVPVRICCIKFAQRVVLSQSVASGAEPKLGGGLDVSLDKVPANHPSLDPRTLEAEAMGLLDRILGILQENNSDPLTVDAALNCLGVLARTRPGTSNRIVNALLSFNPLKLANSPMTPTSRVFIKSMEKTVRVLLIHFIKRDPHNPMNLRIQQHIDRTIRMKAEIFDDIGRKRAPDDLPSEGADAKRQRLAGHPHFAPQLHITPLGPGPHSIAEVFALRSADGLRVFDVSKVPPGLAVRIAVATLAKVDPLIFTKAVEGVRSRFGQLVAAASAELNPNTAPLGVEEDEDDYEPDYYAAEDTEQILNKLDSAPSTAVAPEEATLALKAFKLPPPPTLAADTSLVAGQDTMLRVLDTVKSLEDPSVRKPRAGFARLAASSFDRESWNTVVARLGSRPLTTGPALVKREDDSSPEPASLSDRVRDMLYSYILEDFRRRIDVAVSWLCEEWNSDRANAARGEEHTQHYETWALKLVEGILPYLNAQDKVLTRFLGEIPELNGQILSRVKAMCRDPTVVQLALTSLLYLVMMRPPVRSLALDTVQDIWTEFEDARPMAGKYLQKYRPGFLEAATREAAGEAASKADVASAPVGEVAS